ncbi:MAG: CBS domain-containing protein [Phycisphaerales bacterium]|nr:CBS domain-containing protein [Phycisphaerales bacterium]
MECPYCGWDNIAGSDECGQCRSELRHLDLPRGRSPIEKSIMGDDIVRLMRGDAISVSPDTPLRDVVRRLVDEKRHCALVIKNDAIAGIFTERDALMKTAHRFGEAADRPVEQFMTRDPECLRPNDTLNYGLNKMVVGNYRHLPIEDHGRAIGVVSVRDVLAYVVERYGDVMGAAV